MKIKSKHPFTEYNCYLIHHKKMNRKQVCLVNPITKERKTILYSKFLMSIEIGRVLNKDEEVDHIDGDKTNDSLSNLEIVTPKENRERYNKSISRNVVSLICPNCNKEFEREKRQTHLTKGGDKTFCSRSCSSLYLHSTKKEIPHGTKNGYSYHKCRCLECKEANRTSKRNYNESVRGY